MNELKLINGDQSSQSQLPNGRSSKARKPTLTEHPGGPGPGTWLTIAILERRKLRTHSKLLPEGQNTQAESGSRGPPLPLPPRSFHHAVTVNLPLLGFCSGQGPVQAGHRGLEPGAFLHAKALKGRDGHLHTFLVTGQRGRGGVGRASYFQAKLLK